MPMHLFNDEAAIKKIDEKAIIEIRTKAEAGDGDALNTLACCYYYGHRVPQDKTKAFQLFQQASGPTGIQNPYATYNMGQCYLEGIGTDKNEKLAGEAFCLAKILQHPKANEMLEHKAFTGKVNFFEVLLQTTRPILLRRFDGTSLSSDQKKYAGLEKGVFCTWVDNGKQFDKNYQPAIKQIMGDLFSFSIGTNQVDTILVHEQAVRFYAFGLKDNSLYCNFRLAMYYFKGKCLEKNPIKTAESAFSILQKVALSKDKDFIAPLLVPINFLQAQAYHQIGLCYLKGEGTPKNTQYAQVCFDIAYELHSLETYKTVVKPALKIEEKAKVSEVSEKAKAEAKEHVNIEAKIAPIADRIVKEQFEKGLESYQQIHEMLQRTLKLKGEVGVVHKQIEATNTKRINVASQVSSVKKEQIEIIKAQLMFPGKSPEERDALYLQQQRLFNEKNKNGELPARYKGWSFDDYNLERAQVSRLTS